MHGHRLATAIWVLIAILVAQALAQSSRPDPSIQIRSDFSTAARAAEDLERRDGLIPDPEIAAWLQGIATRLASISGVKPLDPRITRSVLRYAHSVPGRFLYISAALFIRIDSEAELAGLMAHQIAHAQGPTPSSCVMSPHRAAAADPRESERIANAAAIRTLRSAGYDPTGVLDILSKAAYENPEWGRAIVAEDLLELRLALETDVVPPEGYRIDSSEFMKQHSRLSTLRQTTR